jgi:hypothetical protein
MSEFGGDLSEEKLGEIQNDIDRIESALADVLSNVDEAKGDIDRLETIEFFDRGNESRQVIVHWLEDTDPETIVSLGDARDAFVEFSELRAEDNKEHQVSHGDVLVIGGSCPWFAMCAKVDRGKGGGDAGFQDSDPFDPPVAGTEEENDEPFKEFIVWGGCGNGEDGSGGDGDDGCVGTPSSISVSTALAVTSGGAGPPLQLSAITPDPDAPDPPDEFTFNSGLSEFTIVEDSDVDAEKGASFLAFDDSNIDACWGADGNELCGIKAGLVITELEKKLHKINAKPIEQKKVTIYPQKLNSKNYTSQTGTITVSTATISSDKCGNLSSDGGGGGGGGSGTNFGLATLIEGAPIHDEKDIDLLNIEDVEPDNLPIVSIGNLILPSDFSKTSIENSDDSIKSFIDGKKAFIPMVEPDTCPISSEINVVDSFWADSTTAEVTRNCDETGTQEITVSMYPKKNKLEFKCGLLVQETPEESHADSTPMTFKMTLPCGGSGDLSWKDIEICENGVSSTIQVAFKNDDGAD